MKADLPPLASSARPWLLLAALACTLPHAEHQPLWLSALVGVIFAGAAVLVWQQRALPPRVLLIILVVAGSGGIWLEFRTLFGREPGVAMLVLFMAMKLLEMKTRRDATVLVTLGYFLLLTHYFEAQDILAALWLLCSLVLLTACLIVLHGGMATRPAATLRQSARLCAQALPFMLILYLLFPRISGPLWGLPADAQSARTGLSDSMRPGSIAELVQNPEIAFRVKFAGPPPSRERLYWRGPVMESFDGQTWQPSRVRPSREQIDYLSTPLAYELTLEPHAQRWLLALDAPRELPPESRLDGRLTVVHQQSIDQRRRFALSSSLDYRFNAEESPASLSRNLQLPADLNPRSRALAEGWRASAAQPEAIMGQALALFSSQEFAYTLQPPPLGTHGVDDFLFSTRRGFCEHFASAFVFLMRAAGVPARVVGGYQGGEMNPVDGYLVVRQSDAHAWAEVWLAGRGWVRVDPTAAVAPQRVETGLDQAIPASEASAALVRLHTTWLRTLRFRWEALNNAWYQQVIGYDGLRQRDLLDHFGLPDADWRQLASLLASACALALLALAAWALRQPAGSDPAQRLWQKALRQIARRRVDFAPWETPLVIAARVEARCPDLAKPFARLTAVYLAARYGRGNLPALRAALWHLRRQSLRRFF